MDVIDPTTQGFTRALIVGAHPDDAEFYAGGTAMRLARAGCEVHLVVCTDGQRGSLTERSDLGTVRRAEQEAAVRKLGLASLVNLGRPDGELVPDGPLVAELVRAIRRTRPDVVLVHDPDTRYKRLGGRTFPVIRTTGRQEPRPSTPSTRARSARASFRAAAEPDLQLWMPRHFWLFDTRRDTRVWRGVRHAERFFDRCAGAVHRKVARWTVRRRSRASRRASR